MLLSVKTPKVDGMWAKATVKDGHSGGERGFGKGFLVEWCGFVC